MLENTLENLLDCKEIQPVHLKGDQSWIFIGRTDVEAVSPVLWPPDVKSWLIGKDPNAGKDWRQEEKGTTEDEDGWMASLTQWAWVWVNSWSWQWTGRPGVLRSMGSQRVQHDWVTELTGAYFDLLEKFVFLNDSLDDTQPNNCMLACLILTSGFLSKAVYLQPFSKHFSIFMKWFLKF